MGMRYTAVSFYPHISIVTKDWEKKKIYSGLNREYQISVILFS